MRVTPASLALIAKVLDEGTFVAWDDPALPPEHSEQYREEWLQARERAGVDEAIITGEGLLRGRPVAVIVGEFAFLGGSIGEVAATRVRMAVRRATERGLPVLASPASGGTRMQEGTRAFVQMASIAAAVRDHSAAGLPYLVYLRHPTTGGVFASWGSMGHVTAAEPGALIGFLGPRVYRALHGRDIPAGVQTAENLHAHGIVDAVIDAGHLARLAHDVLSILDAPTPTLAATENPGSPATPDNVDDWSIVQRSRDAARPGVRALLAKADGHVVPLSGTGRGEADGSMVVALARLEGRGVVVIGQDRRAQAVDAPLGPGALRAAMRGVELAEQLRLPIVTVIDTPGAALSVDAEEGGLAVEIGRCLAAMLDATVPSVSVIMGEGAGGAALALLPADEIISVEAGWLSPLPPEGASAIAYRDADHADSLARQQRIGSWHLLNDGVIDDVVTAASAAETTTRVLHRIAQALARQSRLEHDHRRARRAHRFDHLATTTTATTRSSS